MLFVGVVGVGVRSNNVVAVFVGVACLCLMFDVCCVLSVVCCLLHVLIVY